MLQCRSRSLYLEAQQRIPSFVWYLLLKSWSDLKNQLWSPWCPLDCRNHNTTWYSCQSETWYWFVNLTMICIIIHVVELTVPFKQNITKAHTPKKRKKNTLVWFLILRIKVYNSLVLFPNLCTPMRFGHMYNYFAKFISIICLQQYRVQCFV